jgi:uncharacterized protein YndB with AHSA1/START domain
LSFDLRLERTYDAAPEVVFDAFTDPQAQQELYADAPDRIVQTDGPDRAPPSRASPQHGSGAQPSPTGSWTPTRHQDASWPSGRRPWPPGTTGRRVE